MKVCHTLICFFFLTLRDRNTGLLNAEILDRTVTAGGNITVKCSFLSKSGRMKFFCKKECEEKDILVQTPGDRAQSGRYSIEHMKGFLHVSISNLTKSDSGRYRCSLDRRLFPDSKDDFDIRVEDGSDFTVLITSKPNWTLRPFSTSVPSASTLTITQSLSSRSGSSTSSSASPEATKQSQKQQTKPAAGPAQTTTGVLLYVCLILVVMIIVSSMAVLIFCRRRASKPKEPPVEMERANMTEANRVYEEVREEDEQSRSPPVEISTVYSCAKYTKPNGVETTDDYSFATAASPQNKIEDNSNKLTYSEVDFSNGPAASLDSAACGDADNVVYSVPRVAASSDGSHAEEASAPLYSTVTLHQL